jgi:hypothetical protein
VDPCAEARYPDHDELSPDWEHPDAAEPT